MSENVSLKNKLKIQLHAVLALILLLHSFFYLVYWFGVGGADGSLFEGVQS